MELNAENNKVFGQEMAKLFATQVSEEELMKAARQSWESLRNKDTYWNQDSEIDKLIKQAIKDRLKVSIEEVTSTEQFKTDMARLAQQMVDEITKKTHEKIVETISDRMASLTAGYNGYGLKNMIENVIVDMMQR